jgi:hypothetical protein
MDRLAQMAHIGHGFLILLHSSGNLPTPKFQ